MNCKVFFFLLLSIFLSSFKTANAVHCYECDSSDDMTCGETLAFGHTLIPVDCSKLQEPKYCVKMTGLYEGELGTKRFCAARDFGNECNMVRRPGDEREYRACILTCEGYGCNPANALSVSCPMVVSLSVLFYLRNILRVV